MSAETVIIISRKSDATADVDQFDVRQALAYMAGENGYNGRLLDEAATLPEAMRRADEHAATSQHGVVFDPSCILS